MRSALLGAVLLLVAQFAYVTWYFQWERRNTEGLAFFGQSLEGRRRLKRRIRWYSLPGKPLILLIAMLRRSRLTMPVFEYEGVSGPPRVSSPEIFARARHYEPRPEDVFVVTQMRSGTTWMQQLVYQIVTRGRGDFDVPGRTHLYALSPWIEAVNGVSIDNAPLVGDRPTRIIKSHLPASMCPGGGGARYIYVARHPVSCFASIVDFNRSMVGPLLPPLDTLAGWFCSDRMYWLPWPRHVDGWWRRAEDRTDTLFVHFEEMTRDLGAVCDRVAALLGCSLTAAERSRVLERCTFDYMKAHEEWFEMAPPTMFSVVGGRFLASGRAQRHQDVTPRIREQILSWCRNGLSGSPYPSGRFYPDLS